MGSAVTQYELEDGTTVLFEYEPTGAFQLAGPEDIAGRIKAATVPALRAAREVLDQARDLSPDEVSVSFGIKVSGEANFLVAKAATEANFEVTLTWTRAVE